jgi:protein gp37
VSDRSSIEWTDATWNPVTGCTKVSAGCDNCYAETFAERWRGTPGHHFENGFDVQLRPDKLDQPLRWKKPRRIFVNSMSDLLHEKVPNGYVADVFAVMALTPQHTYQLLTKRHGRLRSLLNNQAFWYEVGRKARHRGYHNDRAANHLGDGSNIYDTSWWETHRALPNAWLGVSVENQRWAEGRIPALLETPAAVRWISAEPLLGALDLRNLKARNGALIDCLSGDVATPEGDVYCGAPSVLDWVVVGGESGAKARPMHPDWARSLRDQCEKAHARFLFKQWGAWAPWASHLEGEDGPGDTFVNLDGATGHVWFNEDLGRPTNYAGQWGEDSQVVSRAGKKRAGRELDGRTWDEFPQAVTA